MAQSTEDAALLRSAGQRRVIDTLKNHRGAVIAYLALAGVILADMLFLYRYGRQLIDSDMSSEMVLANMLNGSGGFLSHDWIYSTELRVVATTQLFRIGLLIFPENWLLARMTGQLIALLLLSGGAVYMSRGIGFSHAAGALLAAVLCAPISFWSLYMIGFGGHYASHLIVITFSTGLALRLSRLDSPKWRNMLRWGCLCFLGLLSGLNGVRLLMSYTCPLLVAAAALCYMAARERTLDAVKRQEYRQACTLLIVAGVFTLVSLVGYVINEKVLVAGYSFKAYAGQTLNNFTFSALLDSFSNLLVLFGYQQTGFYVTGKLISAEGIGSVLGLCTGAAVFFFFILCLRKWGLLTLAQKLTVALFAGSLFICGVVFTICSDIVNESYWLLVFPLAFATLCVGISVCDFRLPHARKVMCGLLCVCMLCSGYAAVSCFVRKPLRAVPERAAAADWLVENGYRQGYATFWNSNVLTELSSGKLEMWTVRSWDSSPVKVHEWLQQKEHLQRHPSDDRLFMVIGPNDSMQDDRFMYSGYTNVKLEYEDPAITIYTFDNPHLLTE